MSNKLVTYNLRALAAKQIFESLDEPANTVYYTFMARHTPYESGDDNIPTPNNSSKSILYNPYADMTFAKRLSSSDVKLMVNRYDWETNTVYTQYDDVDGSLDTKPFFVCVNAASEYHVFKCIYNNNDKPSNAAPSFDGGSGDDYYETADGYQWKYMYTITASDFSRFATSNLIPIIVNANVVSNAAFGAVDNIKVVYGGSNYDTFIANTFSNSQIAIGGNNVLFGLPDNASPNSNFYTNSVIYITQGTGAGQLREITNYVVAGATKTITVASEFLPRPDTTSQFEITPGVVVVGDGSNLVARALVNTSTGAANSIYKVEVINRGSSYAYAVANVVGNTGVVGNTAVIRPILSPFGGHGKDAATEFKSRTISFNTRFSNNETGLISTDNDFRTVGILRDPLFANVEVNFSTIDGDFVVGERVYEATFEDLKGVVSVNTATNVITGTNTNFLTFGAGDILSLGNGSVTSFHTVANVTNSTSLTLTSNGGFTWGNSFVQKVSTTTTGIVSSVVDGNTVTLANVAGVLEVNSIVFGINSSTFGTISDVNINGVSKNFNIVDQRHRFVYTSKTSNFDEDEVVYIGNVAVTNAVLHSFDGTSSGNLYLTNLRGSFTLPATIIGSESLAQATITEYFPPDLVINTGEVLYLENFEPVERSNSQNETIRINLQF